MIALLDGRFEQLVDVHHGRESEGFLPERLQHRAPAVLVGGRQLAQLIEGLARRRDPH